VVSASITSLKYQIGIERWPIGEPVGANDISVCNIATAPLR
jgi:hypothetical protein